MTHTPDFSSDDGGINADPSDSKQRESTQKNWVPTKGALDRFFDHLSSDRDDAAQKYEALRRKLIRYFEWQGSSSPDLQTDQTIDRVILKINEGQVISNLTPYVLKVARHVAQEDWRERNRLRSLDDETVKIPHPSNPDPLSKLESEETDHRLSCFDRCLESLSPESRKLILSYYQEDGHAKIVWRKGLAEQLGVPLNALRIRVFRIRKALEQCIEDCLAQLARTTS